MPCLSLLLHCFSFTMFVRLILSFVHGCRCICALVCCLSVFCYFALSEDERHRQSLLWTGHGFCHLAVVRTVSVIWRWLIGKGGGRDGDVSSFVCPSVLRLNVVRMRKKLPENIVFASITVHSCIALYTYIRVHLCIALSTYIIFYRPFTTFSLASLSLSLHAMLGLLAHLTSTHWFNPNRSCAHSRTMA